MKKIWNSSKNIYYNKENNPPRAKRFNHVNNK